MTDTLENVAASEEAQAASEPTEQAMNVHPVADLFPLLEGEELDGLAEDIKANGLREPIKRYNGMLIDGRNRTNACKLAGVKPRFEDMTFASEAEVIAYIISLNIHRRHLNESQRSLIGGEIAKMSHGGDRRSDQSLNSGVEISQVKAAQLMHVSRDSVQKAKQVLEHCDQETIKRVRDGKESLHKAASKAKAAKLSTGKSDIPQASARRTKKEEKHAYDLMQLNQAWKTVLAVWNKAGHPARKEFLKRVERDTGSIIRFDGELYEPKSEAKLLPAPSSTSHEALLANNLSE